MLDLYFRGLRSGEYRGIDGVMYPAEAGVSPNEATVMATMGGKPHRLPFKIFATDYETYDISYSCEE